MEALRKDIHYTYADYLTWDNDVRCELIDGAPCQLAAPTPNHQRVVGRLYRQLANYLEGKPCEAFFAPFDVRLNAAQGDDTVVQPDILVVCDQKKLDDKGCIGAPDMVIEVLSPATAGRDCLIKLHWYMKSGVREYWIVDPDSKRVSVHVLKEGKYSIMPYADMNIIPVKVLNGCEIQLSNVFAE